MKKTILLLCTVLVMVSCTTEIKKIRENRSDYIGKEVTVEGTVEMKVPFSNIYQLKDETGEIFVSTSSDQPNKDEKYKVVGTVKEKKIGVSGFQLMNELYIEEKERK